LPSSFAAKFHRVVRHCLKGWTWRPLDNLEPCLAALLGLIASSVAACMS
jgi:hypothetical protein